ncbi:MAG TPA: cob(I)yrinic acid a,c-diamide adenosyltransferase [Thermoanaerobaculia bacterium]|nr:cob(I)yrinic acid a,c-diamide adenosyltransferase [Thermoanaerobaculia bacterium]
MKIYTRGGDAGETSLLAGDRVAKDSPRIEAYGTVDELSSFLGVARASWPGSPIDAELGRIQSDLFDLGATLAAPGVDRFPGVASRRIEALEQAIDAMESELMPLKNFILPGGSLVAAQLHASRAICRRAERCVVSLGDVGTAGATSIAYLNRLSDYLFVAARYANRCHGIEDVPWIASRRRDDSSSA